MRRNANREERGGRLLSALAAAVLLTLLLGIIHRLYHCEYTDTDTPNDCFAVSAATGETALPKIVCLTFDDGPSKNTVPILEILDREQVPATFFVCAQDANERYLPLVADIAAAGHQIALHSATHQYSKIYASTDAFWQDIKALRQALEDEKLMPMERHELDRRKRLLSEEARDLEWSMRSIAVYAAQEKAGDAVCA